MGIALLFLIGVSILIGYEAQISKGRNGAGWGILTFAILFVLFFWAWPTERDVLKNDDVQRVIASIGAAGFASAMAIIFGGIPMAVIVLTLPSRKPSGKKCPQCAELVQPEALKCRFCGNEFQVVP